MSKRSNEKLNRAKEAKNDEFYTRYDDVKAECENYDFSGQVVYCNCDDYKKSKFFQYFYDNFNAFGLKGLISSAINGNAAKYDGKTMQTFALKNGSFDSDETAEFLKECDVVVTNPPFSLLRKFIDVIKSSGKKFLFIAPQVHIANRGGLTTFATRSIG